MKIPIRTSEVLNFSPLGGIAGGGSSGPESKRPSVILLLIVSCNVVEP